MTSLISRRRVLVATALAGVAALWQGRSPLPGDPPSALSERVLGIFRDRSAAAAVGEAYLQHTPAERDVVVLLERLFETEPAGAAEALDRAALHAMLRGRLRRDFAESRTVLVDGWLLAETEARLCALAALA